MKMTLREYFSSRQGIGVLATADAEGRTDAAIYSTPHVFDNGTVAFIMRERLTHHNLQSNAFATFLFVETSMHYQGIRLFLKKTKEETDSTLIAQMTRRHLTPEEDRAKGPKFLVHFKIEKALPLIGSGEPPVSLG
jgi:hypothetical protein